MFKQVIKDALYHRDQKGPELLSLQDHAFVRQPQRHRRESTPHQCSHLLIRALEHLAIEPKLITKVLKEQTFVVPLCWLLRTSVQKTRRLHQPDFPLLSLSSGE